MAEQVVTALAESGEAAPRLARLSSTTFDAQLAVASLAALADAVIRLQFLVSNQDAAGFTQMMRRGQSYLQDRAAARQT